MTTNGSPAIEIAAERSGPPLRLTSMSTIPLPVPLCVRRRTQSAEPDARQTHPSSVERRTDVRPPSASTRALGLASSKRQGAASWLIVTRMSLTPTAADREIGCAFAATAIASVALPCPASGFTTAHEASLAAVHAQSRATVTVSDTVEPAAGIGAGGFVRVI
jgi:hypothetical protein